MTTPYNEVDWSKGIFNSPSGSYDRMIVQYTGGQTLEQIRTFFKESYGEPLIALNLLGQPRVLRETGINGCSVSLEDPRDPHEVLSDTELGIFHLITDVNNIGATNEKLLFVLKCFERARFDLIFSRAIAGDLGLTPEVPHLVEMFSMFFSLLSDRGIFIYHGVPGKISQYDYQNLIDELENLTGREIEKRLIRDELVGWSTQGHFGNRDDFKVL